MAPLSSLSFSSFLRVFSLTVMVVAMTTTIEIYCIRFSRFPVPKPIAHLRRIMGMIRTGHRNSVSLTIMSVVLVIVSESPSASKIVRETL